LVQLALVQLALVQLALVERVSSESARQAVVALGPTQWKVLPMRERRAVLLRSKGLGLVFWLSDSRSRHMPIDVSS
jgi:hypothetical protein